MVLKKSWASIITFAIMTAGSERLSFFKGWGIRPSKTKLHFTTILTVCESFALRLDEETKFYSNLQNLFQVCTVGTMVDFLQNWCMSQRVSQIPCIREYY